MDITIAKLKELWDLCIMYYTPEFRKMKLLDATDRGELWKALGTKFPPYQILPDTNFVSYVKNNILASIYTVAKSAQIIPTSEEDKQLLMELNLSMERIWNLIPVGYYQFCAGDRAALLNLGITQVGWDDSLSGGSGTNFYKGNVSLKNINPMKFMRDPFANDLDSSGYCMTYDILHKSVFMKNPLYKDKFKEYLAKNAGQTPEPIPTLNGMPLSAAKDHYALIIYWVVDDDGSIHEIHVVNNTFELARKEKIRPNAFPFALLYCNEPSGALIGTSECAKIFANNVAYNLMDSIALTAEYKNQRPPKFISSQSGLNVRAFARHGDDADRTFIVNGDATKAVHYHQFPQTSAGLPQIQLNRKLDIQLVSGIDGRYTGRDTGSIITTGGTEEMLNRVTLIDTPKIMNYENYTKQLTRLILGNLVEFCPKRKYFYRKPNSLKWDTITVDFPKIDKSTVFEYEAFISSDLPRNKQRIAEMANMLMEKQMQYQQQGSSVQLITEEEWLMFQDLPNKEYMLERMGLQRLTNATEEVSQVLFQYADLVRKGATPDEAILATAETLKRKRMGQMPEEGIIPEVAQEEILPPEGAL